MRTPSPYTRLGRRRPTRRADWATTPASAAGASLLTAADTFTRADGAIGTSSSGHVWSQIGVNTGWTIASNTCDPPAATGYSFALLDLTKANVDMTVTFNPNFQTCDWGLCAKVVDANNLLFFNIGYDTDHWVCRVYQRVSGSFNGLFALVNPVVTLGADKVTPFTMRLVSNGAAGQAYVNGVSQGTWSALADPGILAATKHGLATNDCGATATFDNLTMTEI